MIVDSKTVVTLLLALVSVPASSTALPVISEAYYDAPGSDNGQSFVELYGLPGTSLDGLILEGVNGSNGSIGPTVSITGTIPVDGFFVIADDAGDGTTSVANADFIANFDFQNGPDSIRLTDGTSVIDAVGYGVFDPAEVFAGEGSPALDPPAGSSLERLFANLDSDDNAVDFAELSVPTPGSAPLFVTPEPAVAALVVPGLVSLAWLGRRPSRRR